jgi:tetratricopeptide (TPR) repeat protein
MHSAELSIMVLKQKEKELEAAEREEVELLAAQSVLEKRVREGPAVVFTASEADLSEVTDQSEGADDTSIRVQPDEKEKSYSKDDTEVHAPYYEQTALSASPPLEVEKPLDQVRDQVRDMWARLGDQVEISFGNRGWVFLGLRDSRELKGLIFVGSKDLGRKVIFHFRSEDYGVYLLEFQLQDNRTATVKNESVRLSVVTDDEFDSRLASAAIEMSDKGEEERFLLAEKLYGLEQYEAALKEYISGYREGVPLVNDRIASIYLHSGEYQAAAKFYEKNSSSGGELGEKAVVGLVRSYLALEESIKLIGLLDKFLGLEYLSIEEDLMHIIHYEIEHGEPALTYKLLTEYVSGFPGGVFLDEVYFLFGQLFEGESPYRDLERSREYYLRVYEKFPASVFSEEARERVKYLERYFFYIR